MKQKNRAWVKNAAIVFLSVLLVLTFFSNTIMNRSLPEVSGQSAYGGEISTAVRGQGTVVANEAYSIELETSRQIKRVLVKQGDMVEAGQAIFELEPADSSELQAAIKTLEDMEYNFNVKLLSVLSSDYEIEDLKEALEDAIESKEKSVLAAAALEKADMTNDAAQENLRLKNEEIEDINNKIAELTNEINSGLDEDLLDDDMKAKKLAVEHAKENLEQATKDYNDALAGGGGPIDLSSYLRAVDQAAAAEGVALTAAERAMRIIDWEKEPYAAAKDEYDKYDTAASGGDANASVVNGLLRQLLNNDAVSGVEAVNNWKVAAEEHLKAKDRLEIASQGGANGSYISQLREYVERCERSLKRAEEAWEEATRDIRVEGKVEREQLRARLKTKQTELVSVKKAATSAEEALIKAKQDAALTPEDADQNIKLASRALERKARELQNAEALRDLEFDRDLSNIADQEEIVAKLRERETGTEVTTRYGGTVLDIHAMPGDNTMPGSPLATIEINGKGYTLTFSVTNEETQRVRVGDVATISSWGRGDTTCTLVAIKTDRDNPSRRKILEFDVTGDNVTAGMNLEISVGTRSQYYNNIVPNSAIREDADGKFVLIAVAKQTPLGTRYIATRTDIDILDSDTKNTAISGDFDWAPYIITTSSKPIEPNTQVRLVG